MINQQLANGVVSVTVDLSAFDAAMARIRASMAGLGAGGASGAGGGASGAVSAGVASGVASGMAQGVARGSSQARNAMGQFASAAVAGGVASGMAQGVARGQRAATAPLAQAVSRAVNAGMAQGVNQGMTYAGGRWRNARGQFAGMGGGSGGGAGRTAAGAGMGLLQGLGLGGFATNPAQLAGQVIGGGVSMMADGLKDAVANSMDLEQTFTGLQRVSGESAANVEKFKRTIFDIGKTQAGVSIRDLTDISMAGAKAGITDKEGLAGLETFTRGMAKVRNSVQGIGTEQLADNMVRMLNLFHKGTDYVQSFGSVLARMDNISTSSAGDILDMSKSLSGTFASLGMGIPQVMAFSSVLSDVGLTNQQGASSFSQILRMMASDSAGMATKIGVPIEEFQQKIRTDAMGALGMLIARFRELNEVDPLKAQEFIAGLGFRGVKTAGALQQLSSIFEQVQERTAMAIEEETSLGSLQAANNLNSTTAISNIQMLKNAFEELSDAIGSKVVPHLTTASKVALEMIRGMTGEGPRDITPVERAQRALINAMPEAMRFPADKARVAEIDRKEATYNARLNTAVPTPDERLASLERSRAGATGAGLAQIDAAIANVKMEQADARAKSPEGMAEAARSLLGRVTKVPGFGAPLAAPEFPGLPGMAYEQMDLRDPATRERPFVGPPIPNKVRNALDRAAMDAKPGVDPDFVGPPVPDKVRNAMDRAEIKANEKKFSSQHFGDGADFGRNAIQTALSDKEPNAAVVDQQKETNRLLALIEGKSAKVPTPDARATVAARLYEVA